MSALPRPDSGADRALADHLGLLDLARLRHTYLEQGAFLSLPQFLPPGITSELVAAVAAVVLFGAAAAANNRCPCAIGTTTSSRAWMKKIWITRSIWA